MTLLGGNVTLDYLLTKLPGDLGWEITTGLGMNAIRPLSGKSGDVAKINMDNHSNWDQNLMTLLNKVESYGLKIALHEMGTPWNTSLGIRAPYYNYQPIANLGGTVTPVSEALTKIDKLAGSNSLGHDFLNDPRIPYWQVINEAPANNSTVLDWTAQVADAIRDYGAKVTGCLKDPNKPYAESFPYIMSFASVHFDYIQAHEYFYYPEALNLLGSQGASANIYDAVYNKGLARLGHMMDERDVFTEDEVILGEWGIMHGAFKPPGVSTTYNVTFEQQAQYISGAFDSMKDVGLNNQYYHLVFDDSTETWGMVSATGVLHTVPSNAFIAGINNLKSGDQVSFVYKNRDDQPFTVHIEKVVITERLVTIPGNGEVVITLDPDEVVVNPPSP